MIVCGIWSSASILSSTSRTFQNYSTDLKQIQLHYLLHAKLPGTKAYLLLIMITHIKQDDYDTQHHEI